MTLSRRDLIQQAAVAGAVLSLPRIAKAQGKDSVTLGMTLEPPTLDPTSGAAQAIREVTYLNIFEGLVSLDRNGRLRPCLATSWSVSPDGLTYTFALRGGVTFHDGVVFTSAQVKFAFERATAPDSTNAQKWIFAPIAAIETPDAATVIVRLKAPAANFLYGLAWGDAVIVAPQSAADNKTKPVGTGPYKFARWNRGDRLEFERNDTWWGGRAAIGKVVFRFISDPQAQIAAIRAGDIDALTNLGAPEALAQLKADPRLKVTVGKTEGETILAMNNARAPFSDLRVRQAISHALDRKAIADGVYGFDVSLIGSHFSPLHPAYVDLTGVYPYDVARAKKLLAEAGFPNGFTCTLKLPPPAYARRSGEIIAALLAQIGITATIEPLEFPQWLERVFRGKDFDLTIISHTEPLDIQIYARPDYYFQYRNPDFNALMAKADGATSDEARNAVYGEAQRLLARDAVNGFLFILPKLSVGAAKLDGLWDNWPLPANPLAELKWLP